MIPQPIQHQIAYDASVIHVYVYTPEGVMDLPGTPLAILPVPTPVLLLHGNGETHHIYDALISELSRTRTVIAIDTRGHGESLASIAELTYELFAQDAVEVLDRLGVPEVHVVGFSDGGITALNLGMHHRARVLSLSAIGANLSPDDILPEMYEEMRVQYEGMPAPTADEDFEDIERRLLRLMLEQPHIDPAELESIVAPALIMAGENDLIAPEATHLIADRIPSSELAIIEGASHYVLDDAPWTVFELISEFIERHERPNQGPSELAVNPLLEVRKLVEDDKPAVLKLYEDVIASLSEGINYAGWKPGVYPTLEVAERHLGDGVLYGAFVRDTGQLVGSCSLRYDIPEYYNVCGWEVLPQEEVMMIRTLVVSPTVKRMGVAKTLLAFARDLASRDGARAIRFNTSAQNVPANILYRRLGFTRYYTFLLPYRGLDISDWTIPYELRLDETAEEQHIVQTDEL